jgi:ATP-dependent helicase/nuclease subunit B
VADWYLDWEGAQDGRPVLIEDRGKASLDDLDFRLTARPDRIDKLPDGSRLHIIDYKTGTPPSKKQQQAFDKQLLLEAAMAERGAFPGIGPARVARVSYVGLGSTPKIEAIRGRRGRLGRRLGGPAPPDRGLCAPKPGLHRPPRHVRRA